MGFLVVGTSVALYPIVIAPLLGRGTTTAAAPPADTGPGFKKGSLWKEIERKD